MTTDLPKSLRALAESLQVPPTLTDAGLRQRFDDPDGMDAAAGQVRRAEWEGVSQLVLLLGTADAENRTWTVVPVSVDPTGEDENSLVVTAEITTFPVEVTAWAGLAVPVPTGTLGRIIDVWPDDVTHWCADAAAGTLRPPPPGTRRGEPADLYGGSAEVRAGLEDDLHALARADLVPVRAQATVDLEAAAANVGLGVVIQALNLPVAVVLRIVKGKQDVTEDQAAILADLFGYSAAQITGSGVPLELAVELERPRWRPVWKSWAERLRTSEAAVRLTAGMGALRTAYRQTGTGGVPDWAGRLEQWLATRKADLEDSPRGS